MPLCLAEFPIEVLANITSRLTAKDILETLPGAGNALLTHKLRHGGVVDLEIKPYELSGCKISPHHIVACQSLSLRRFTYSGSYSPIVTKLVLGLKPTLRHLYGARTDLIVKPLLSDMTDRKMLETDVWNVGTTFPALETLRLNLESHPQLLTDPVSAARFYEGLPPTLTTLGLPPFTGFNFWPLLPPSVTMVYGVANNWPPTLDIAPNLASLQGLTMAARTGDERADVGGFWKINNNSSSPLPPNLTSLEIEGPMRVLTLPRALTRLRYRVAPQFDGNFDVFALVKMLPPSLTCFDVDGGLIDSTLETDLPVMRSMKRFALVTRTPHFHLYSRACTDLLNSMPNLEELKLEITHLQGRAAVRTPENEQYRGLDVQHLSRLNARTLRSLDAEFKPSCFIAAGDGTYPLDPFAKLHTLSIQRRMDSYQDFTFAAIPSSVTSLNLNQGEYSSETLHLLPASVTDLRGNLTVRTEDFIKLCLPCLPTPSGANSMDVSELPVEHSYDQSASRGYLRRFKQDGSDIRNGVAIELTALFLGPICLNLPPPVLVPSLTSIKLEKRYFALDWSTFTQSSLPNLRHAIIPCLPPSGVLDLGSWTSLRDLSITCTKDDGKRVCCPPHLTKLEIRDSTLIDPSLPLPTSLTEIRSESFRKCAVLAHLDKLKSFECHSTLCGGQKNDAERLADLSFLPKGLTFIALPKSTWSDARVIKTLSRSLPVLETIKLADSDLSIRIIDRLYRGFPDRLKFEVSSLTIHALPATIARLCHVPLGSILVPKDGRPGFWCQRTVEETYPRIKGNYYVSVYWQPNARVSDDLEDLDESESLDDNDDPLEDSEGDDDGNGSDESDGSDESYYSDDSYLKYHEDKFDAKIKPSTVWSDFAPYLSPDQEELEFRDRVDFQPGFPKTFPRGLKTLILHPTNIFRILDGVPDLPPNLTVLHLKPLSLHFNDIGALPRSLTNLKFNKLLDSSSDEVRPPLWPLGLVELSFRLGALEDFSGLLPASLTKLIDSEWRKPGLTVVRLRSLPVGLKCYQDEINLLWSEEMVSIALERNLTRFSERPHLCVPLVPAINPTLFLDQILASLRKKAT